ncbi:hypothetical protein [Jatrophihabitans endophyticus]|uniref:hypothetical protein n=1 Tax=Jatrophihabitans endophyticus TaxID=1206085 RepID=UPI0019EC1B96|nr:hypothetical protein [Jatrophihabitans endophyticus]MBE7187438.1 hypothetical protein [Jatrophihabitans endophyticus]
MTDRPKPAPVKRPPLNVVQQRTMIVTLAILLAGAVTFVIVGRGFVVALAGGCATAAVVIGTGIDFLRR